MKNISIVFLALTALFIYACGGDSSSSSSDGAKKPSSMVADEPVDDGKGIGEVKHVALNDPLDAAMIARGSGIYEMKCAACHKLSGQRVVGPGWEGLTKIRKPEWIMNMILNVDVMLEEDPAARALLEECLVRMPNQNLTFDDARDVLEFMLSNDAKL